jgi:ABC-type transport system involved in cytochrome bd biosynthesis fused ATPase/permease subunit
VLAGRPSLALAVVVERDMAVVAMTIVMCAVFVVSLFPVLHALVVSLVVVAGGLLAVTAAREVKDRFRRARIRNRDA